MKFLGTRSTAVKISVVLAMSALVTSCGATADTATTPAPSKDAGEVSAGPGGAPVFTGPYAAEFSAFYEEATSDFVRDVLADEEITDAEYAEMTSRLATCLADQGITLKEVRPDGGLSTSLAPHGGDTHEIVTECSTVSGEDSIGALRSVMRTNPENLDYATIAAECLVRSGTVPQDYGADDFATDNIERFGDLDSLPSDLREAVISCNSDPLGILGADER